MRDYQTEPNVPKYLYTHQGIDEWGTEGMGGRYTNPEYVGPESGDCIMTDYRSVNAECFRGDTEPTMGVASNRYSMNDDGQVFIHPVTDDPATLRQIEVMLAAVESERDSDDAIDSCTNPTRRSEFPAAENFMTEDESFDVPLSGLSSE